MIFGTIPPLLEKRKIMVEKANPTKNINSINRICKTSEKIYVTITSIKIVNIATKSFYRPYHLHPPK